MITQMDLTQKIRRAFEAARDARRQGNVRDALNQWARIVEWTEDASDHEHRQARIATCSESALVYQSLGDARRARDLLVEAVRVAEEVAQAAVNRPADEAVASWLALAGVRANLAGLYVASREPEFGEEQARAALDALEKTGDNPSRALLEFASRMQLGTTEMLIGKFEDGANTLLTATEAGIALVESGQHQVLAQLVESAARLFSGTKHLGTVAQSLPLIEKIAQMSTAAFEADSQSQVHIKNFIDAQTHRVNALIEVGRFADAEDQLWHVIDGTGQPDLLIAAPNFYAALWPRDDDALTRGGLPRAEIGESWTEAIDRAEERKMDALAVELMRHRYRFHTEGKREEAQAFVVEKSKELDTMAPVAAHLLGELQRELGGAR